RSDEHRRRDKRVIDRLQEAELGDHNAEEKTEYGEHICEVAFAHTVQNAASAAARKHDAHAENVASDDVGPGHKRLTVQLTGRSISGRLKPSQLLDEVRT